MLKTHVKTLKDKNTKTQKGLSSANDGNILDAAITAASMIPLPYQDIVPSNKIYRPRIKKSPCKITLTASNNSLAKNVKIVHQIAVIYNTQIKSILIVLMILNKTYVWNTGRLV